MLFKLRTKVQPVTLTSADIRALNNIDLAYMRAYTLKNCDCLRGMVSPDCMDKLSWLVQSFNARYFADEKFRHTEWGVINIRGEILTLKKRVTYDKIRINAAMSINAANNYAEQWVVCKQNNIIVMSIEACEL